MLNKAHGGAIDCKAEIADQTARAGVNEDTGCDRRWLAPAFAYANWSPAAHSQLLSRLDGLRGGAALRGGGIVRRIVPIAREKDVRTGRKPGVASWTSSNRSGVTCEASD